MELRDKSIKLSKGEFLIVPKGIEHKPVSKEEIHFMLFEPATTINTGKNISNFTKTELEKI